MNYQNNPYLYSMPGDWHNTNEGEVIGPGINDYRQTPLGPQMLPGFPFMPPNRPPGQFPNYQHSHHPGRPPSTPPRPPYSGSHHGSHHSQQHGGTHEGGGQQGGPPTSPPPQFTPQMEQTGVSLFSVDPGAIRGCLYRFTYVWLNNRSKFWFYPVFVGRNSVAGWRWRGFRWVYFGIDLNEINNFQCF